MKKLIVSVAVVGAMITNASVAGMLGDKLKAAAVEQKAELKNNADEAKNKAVDAKDDARKKAEAHKKGIKDGVNEEKAAAKEKKDAIKGMF